MRLISLSVVAAIVGLTGCNEIQHRHFDSLDQAQQEHLVDKGWIPPFSPDAKNIDYESDLDSARVNGSYSSVDTTSLRKHCAPTDDSFRVLVEWPKSAPNDVKEARTAGALKSKGYETLHCDEGDFNVVISDSRKSVFYWSIRGH
jgi:hypothetical protein